MIAGVLIITLVISFFMDWLVTYIPFEYEQQLVQKYEPATKQRDEVDVYLQGLADRVAVAMELPAKMKIKIHYINDNMVNAFATFGGHVMVLRGLMEKLPSENALVMLISHEIAHVKLRHPLRSMSKSVVLSVIFSIVMGQSSDAVSQLMSNAGMMTMLNFSREQEADADEEGLQAMWRYYHHVAGSLALFEVLQKVARNQNSDVPLFLNSHPQTADRIAHLRQVAQAHHWSLQGERRPIPAKILSKLAADRAAATKS